MYNVHYDLHLICIFVQIHSLLLIITYKITKLTKSRLLWRNWSHLLFWSPHFYSKSLAHFGYPQLQFNHIIGHITYQYFRLSKLFDVDPLLSITMGWNYFWMIIYLFLVQSLLVLHSWQETIKIEEMSLEIRQFTI